MDMNRMLLNNLHVLLSSAAEWSVLSLSLSLSLCVCVCVCVHMYVCETRKFLSAV